MTPEMLASLPMEQRTRLFTQWLGNQPENERYCFAEHRNCALAQFAKTLDGIDTRGYVGGGARSLTVAMDGKYMTIFILPITLSAAYAIQSDNFGVAYAGLASASGLPKRSRMKARIASEIARFVKHKHRLAA